MPHTSWEDSPPPDNGGSSNWVNGVDAVDGMDGVDRVNGVNGVDNSAAGKDDPRSTIKEDVVISILALLVAGVVVLLIVPDAPSESWSKGRPPNDGSARAESAKAVESTNARSDV